VAGDSFEWGSRAMKGQHLVLRRVGVLFGRFDNCVRVFALGHRAKPTLHGFIAWLEQQNPNDVYP
jgi:hypothetical protein